jgi:hypothetical protein
MVKRARKEEKEESSADESDSSSSSSSSSEEDKSAKDKPKRKNRNEQGDLYYGLGKKRRVTVRKYEGKKYVDVRQYYRDYKDKKKMKPTKKGFCLRDDQWKKLKSRIAEIDAELERL